MEYTHVNVCFEFADDSALEVPDALTITTAAATVSVFVGQRHDGGLWL